MFPTTPALSLGDALNRVKTGREMDGCLIPADQLLVAMTSIPKAPGECWTITNALLPPFRCRSLTFSSRINFVRCRFIEPTFDSCVFDAPIRIENSSCDGDLIIDHCAFHKDLYFRRLETHGDVKILHTDLAAPPSWDRVHFHGMVEMAAVRALWQGRRRLVIDRCSFTEGIILEIPNLFEIPKQPLHVAFNYCSFDRNSFSKIIWGKHSLGTSGVTCRFVECAIAGRIALRDDSSDSIARPRKSRVDGAQMDLSGSLVSGEVDLQGMRVRWLHLDRFLFAGGQILLNKDDLWDRWTWQSGPFFAAGDRCGILRGEQVLFGIKDLPAPQTSQELGTPAAIAEQYETLRDCYARIANSDWEEDYCHYKCRNYRRLAKWHELEKDIDGSRFMVGTGLLFVAVFLSVIPVILELAPAYLPILILLAGILAAASFFYRKAVTLVGVIWDWLILKWLIGYGMYARRSVQNGFGMVLLFAGIYYVSTEYWPNWGKVAGSDGVTILEEITPSEIEEARKAQRSPTPQQVSSFVAMRRCIYFSVVTFTTLGYGDYHPERNLQIVSSVEVILGAIMIAMITVVFARKFLR